MSEVKVCPQCGNEVTDGSRFCPLDGAPLRPKGAAGTKDLAGTVVADRFLVLQTLGEGGMGRVYLAEHVRMGRKCALKVMSPRMAADPDAISRFNREAANAARINHPNVCAVYDFGETSDGTIYLAMEFVEGAPLTRIVEQHGALDPRRAASIAMQTADALAAAHELGIVHRDLKPDNIMIARGRDGGDVVKVVDFGIAKMADNDAQKVTKTGLVVGTPEYMSPEQLAGDRMDGRSDIYSLALVTFNMLTGTLPFPADSQQEAMIMRLTDRPRRLAEMSPAAAWTPELQAVFDRALERDARKRYASAVEFGRDLVAAVAHLPEGATSGAGTQLLAGVPPEPEGVPRGVDLSEMAVGGVTGTGVSVPQTSVPTGRSATRGVDATGTLPATVSAPAGSGAMAAGGGGRRIPVWAMAGVGLVVVVGLGGAFMLQGRKDPADGGQAAVTTQGQPTSPLSARMDSLPSGGNTRPIEDVLAEVNQLVTPSTIPDAAVDQRNGDSALALLDALMPRLTTRSDSTHARFLRAQAHFLMSQADEGCRILRRIVPAELNATHRKTLDNLLGSCP